MRRRDRIACCHSCFSLISRASRSKIPMAYFTGRRVVCVSEHWILVVHSQLFTTQNEARRRYLLSDIYRVDRLLIYLPSNTTLFTLRCQHQAICLSLRYHSVQEIQRGFSRKTPLLLLFFSPSFPFFHRAVLLDWFLGGTGRLFHAWLDKVNAVCTCP